MRMHGPLLPMVGTERSDYIQCMDVDTLTASVLVRINLSFYLPLPLYMFICTCHVAQTPF